MLTRHMVRNSLRLFVGIVTITLLMDQHTNGNTIQVQIKTLVHLTIITTIIQTI
jgi:hypothetical protein